MRRSAVRGRRLSFIFVVCWAIPAAGLCALAFRDGFVPGQPFAAEPAWMAGPAGAVLAGLAVGYAFFWLSLPVGLLLAGICQLRATAPAGWRWLSMWTGAVLAGIALDPLGLWALNTTYTSDGFQWTWLTAATGYLAIGAALTAILIAAPRSSSTASPATRLTVR